MAHKVESMAYAGAKPWHGLGKRVSDKMTPEEVAEAAGLNWTVSKRQMYFANESRIHVEAPGKFMLARDTDDHSLSIVGGTYKPIQNMEAIAFFKEFCSASKMTMETAGSLDTGRYIWALAKFARGFKLGKNDAIDSYLLLCQPHVINRSFLIQTTAVRVVCWNTLTYAIGSNLKGSASAFRMPHCTVFDDDVKQRAKEALGLATVQMDEFREAATLLAAQRAHAGDVNNFFCEVLNFDPAKAKAASMKEPPSLKKFHHALTYAPGQSLASAAGTWWGAVNAVSYVVDHVIGTNRDTALTSAWLGERAGIKRKAVSLAIDYAKLAKAA